MASTQARRYEVRARSSGTFGRVLLTARDQHLVVDGPVDNGCPGEAVTPAEMFLGAVASCGVELVEVIARERGAGLRGVSASVDGTIDRARQTDPDHTVFSRVRLHLGLDGVDEGLGAELVEAFKSR